ncbi:MAG: hypothetical protein ACR2F1_00835 [Nitrososphaeraceae archaeon]
MIKSYFHKLLLILVLSKVTITLDKSNANSKASGVEEKVEESGKRISEN